MLIRSQGAAPPPEARPVYTMDYRRSRGERMSVFSRSRTLRFGRGNLSSEASGQETVSDDGQPGMYVESSLAPRRTLSVISGELAGLFVRTTLERPKTRGRGIRVGCTPDRFGAASQRPPPTPRCTLSS